MLRNIGTADRWVRIVVGFGLLALVFTGPQTAWGYLGLLPIATALVGFCPIYRAFGISTNRSRATHPGRTG